LRIAFVVCPAGEMTARVADGLRAVSLMPAPLMAAVASNWIRDGRAEALLQGVRQAAAARRAIAARELPEARGPADSIHVWLPLPASRSLDRLRLAAQEKGLSLVTADAFAVAPQHPNGVRISLGGVAKPQVLTQALVAIAGLVRDQPSPGRLVV
jgi:DNA-binding transcriptional MocR family regulator